MRKSSHSVSRSCCRRIGFALLALALVQARGQMSPPQGPLDPARGAVLQPAPQNHLSEQFIWTANDAAAHDPRLQASVRGQDDKIAPHYFRAHFRVASIPQAATLYLAGPRAVTAYLNGHEILRATDDGTRPKNLSVLTADVSHALQAGNNVLALELVRGHSSLHTGASPTINQITYGEVLAAKIVPRGVAVDAPPLLVSDPEWRSTLQPIGQWQAPATEDASWPKVESIGVLGSKRDFLQWNADAGLYAWPGYDGIGDDLRVFDLHPTASPGAGRTTVLDFAREISGRLRVQSKADRTIQVTASYGESREEAIANKGYLGSRTITVPPHGTAFGPKSAFRYVALTYPAESSPGQLTISAQAITYPVEYLGSFESSDPQLNRIWETAAYTARLCMQEGIWDGVKRDRGRWMGDLDVMGRTIDTVFANPAIRALMEQTMSEIIGEPPVTRDINTIAGYSALWITGQADFYRHYGDLAYLRSVRPQLIGLLHLMDAELEGHLFTNPEHHKVFVDWSEGFNADLPEARAATHLEFTLAYKEAVTLLRELGEEELASHYQQEAAALADAAQQHLLDPQTQTFGIRWQTNAMAVVSDVATAPERNAIWHAVLSHVGEAGHVVTPYYGYYVLSAMAETGHRKEALDWMRTYWGGMLAEGATSFWEAYDPHWPKENFHAFLEADNKRGYYVSLAHGWSSGPAAWLAEQVLGIHPTAAGFRAVTLRPELAGLAWARGAEPTPRGLLVVDLTTDMLRVTVPPGTRALVQLPFVPRAADLHATGTQAAQESTSAEGRPQVELTRAGEYLFHRDPSVSAPAQQGGANP